MPDYPHFEPPTPQRPEWETKPSGFAYQRSCLSVAYDEWKTDPNRWKMLVLLTLVTCVPILNFAVMGYLLSWSRSVCLGVPAYLPAKIVTKKNFELGFYAFLIGLVPTLINWFLSNKAESLADAYAFAPAIALTVVCVMLGLALQTFVYAGDMRMALTQSLREGFNLRAIWTAMHKDVKGLFGIVLLPALAVVLVGIVVAFIATTLATLCGGSMLGLTLTLVFTVAFLLLVGEAASMITMRAMGHWVFRNAPEWAEAPFGSEGR